MCSVQMFRNKSALHVFDTFQTVCTDNAQASSHRVYSLAQTRNCIKVSVSGKLCSRDTFMLNFLLKLLSLKNVINKKNFCRK